MRRSEVMTSVLIFRVKGNIVNLLLPLFFTLKMDPKIMITVMIIITLLLPLPL